VGSRPGIDGAGWGIHRSWALLARREGTGIVAGEEEESLNPTFSVNRRHKLSSRGGEGGEKDANVGGMGQ
jgi:hypothetical protein